MKLVLVTMLATGLASAAFADHGEPGRGNPGQSGALESVLENLVYAAQNEEQEARYARNVVLAQKYARIADFANRMVNNLSELNSGNVYDPERYHEDLRVKMNGIEQTARGIQNLPFEIENLIDEARAGVDEVTEGGGGIIIIPPEHGGHGRGLFQAYCDVTLVGASNFAMTVSGTGRSPQAAINAAQDAGERQCYANRSRCQFGRCDVSRIR